MSQFTQYNVEQAVREGEALTRQAEMLTLHAKSKRVTHTVSYLIRAVISMGKLVRKAQSDQNFVKQLRRTLDAAHEKASGSMEIVVYEDNTIWLKGAFHIDKLRGGLISIPQPDTTVELRRDQ